MTDLGNRGIDTLSYRICPAATRFDRQGHNRSYRFSDYSNAWHKGCPAPGTSKERSRSFPAMYCPHGRERLRPAWVHGGARNLRGRQICCHYCLHKEQIALIRLTRGVFPADDNHSFQPPLSDSLIYTPAHKPAIIIAHYESIA